MNRFLANVQAQREEEQDAAAEEAEAERQDQRATRLELIRVAGEKQNELIRWRHSEGLPAPAAKGKRRRRAAPTGNSSGAAALVDPTEMGEELRQFSPTRGEDDE